MALKAIYPYDSDADWYHILYEVVGNIVIT